MNFKAACATIVLSLLTLVVGVRPVAATFSDTGTTNGTFAASFWVAPTVAVITPNGGETLFQQNVFTITWSATSSDPAATPTIAVDLYYSTDSGSTYPNTIATGEANDGSYDWTVPSVFSSTVRVKVVATDSHTLVGSDESNADLTIKSPIVINEFLPNPTGADDATKPGGEFVELYNNGTVPVDVNGWALYDNDDTHELVVSTSNSDNNLNTGDGGETIVPAAGFLVVYRDTDVDFELDNTGGDSVRLYNGTIVGGATQVDGYTYTLPDPVPDDKSFARNPDGTGAFVDPDPTPGKPNVITNHYLERWNQSPERDEESPTPTPEPTPEPSETPETTPSASPTPVIDPTLPEATPTPTPSPTPSPTVSPTVDPLGSQNNPSPTPEATPTPTPEPSLDPALLPNPVDINYLESVNEAMFV